MNGTPTTRVARSVQLAVMAAPTTSVVEAVAEARRRHGSADAWNGPQSEMPARAQMAAAA